MAGETGTVVKDWGGKLPFALLYPNSYYVGMSSLGFQTIYRLLNNEPDVVCERVFWEPSLLRGGGPPLSLEGDRPLGDFAALAFSVTFELDYFHVAALLSQAGLPLRSADRDEGHPIVLGGGPCLTANPEPLAPLFDAIAIGEAEAILPGILTVLRAGTGNRRADLLSSLARIPGVYVPEVHASSNVTERAIQRHVVERQWVNKLDAHAGCSSILTAETEFGRMLLLEVARGCGRGCRFCLAGYCFRPMRERSPESLLEQAREGLQSTSRVGLMGPAVSDYSRIDELALGLVELGAKVSAASLRLDRITDGLLRAIVESGTRSIALAPEAGSQRLRGFLSKSIADDTILEAAEKVALFGVRKVKLYYMLGLPSETEDDADEILRLTQKVKQLLAGRRFGAQLTVSISPFVPKAQTPFQWEPMLNGSTLAARLGRIKAGLRKLDIPAEGESPEWAEVQGVLARGDQRLFGVVARLASVSNASILTRKRGHGLRAWKQALEGEGLDADGYLRPTGYEGMELPWTHITSGVSEHFLRGERERALAESPAVTCSGAQCTVCGVCASFRR